MRSDITPWPIIPSGSIPMSIMRPIPVTMVKENIYINMRGIINVRFGNQYYRWRLMDHQRWQGDINSYIDAYFCKASIGIAHQCEKHHAKKHYNDCPFRHKRASSIFRPSTLLI